jgi:hypothetical protein
MTTYFFRHGAEFTGTPRVSTSGKVYTVVQDKCHRCGGQGGSDAWKHTGWTCYRCGGGCFEAPRQEPLYTAEKLAKLNAIKAKADARRAAKHEAKEAALRIEAEAKRAAFEAEFADVLPWLSAQDHESNEFFASLWRCATRLAAFTPAQADALRAAKARSDAENAKRASSDHAGAVGERITITATIERVNSFERPAFNASWAKETVWISALRDTAGNVLVLKSGTYLGQKGSSIVLKATVKEHGDYKGEKQTIIQRPHVISLVEHQDDAGEALAA